MDDAMIVQVLQSTDHLHSIALHFNLVQSFTPLNKVVEGLVWTYFEKNVDVFVIFKEMLKLAYIGVLDAFVDPNLGHQLLLSSSFCERCLLNEFAGKHILRFLADELVALGESSLS